jgi:hypothetical protein
MKKLIRLWKTWKILSNNAGIFSIVADIFKFVETTHKEQTPMVTKIVLLNMGNGEKISDFVSLWAGIGDCSPIERAGQLKSQNVELKRLLQLAKDGNLTDDNKQLIELTLKIFD